MPQLSTAEKRRRLERYLRRRADGGVCYVKSKFIADDVDLTPSEVGALLADLQESAHALDVEKWAYTNATTWRISRPSR